MTARTGKASPPQSPPRGAVPSRSYYRDHDDARRYQWRSASCLLGLYAAIVAAMVGWLPLPLLLLVVPPLYCRAALAAHELMHMRSAPQVPLLHRLMMVFETPVGLGYREHRDIHIRHHKLAATAQDPEFFQIRGSPMRAFAHAMISPEWAFVSHVRTFGVSRTLLAEASVRLLFFAALAFVAPVVFAWYWVAMRLSVGTSNFVFHHVLHNRGGRYGTFDLRLPDACAGPMHVLFGREGTSIVTEHRAHHAWQHVQPGRLRGLLDEFPKPVV